MSTEKFCLRWNDFEANISEAFKELRDDKDFFDVTLACEDEQVQAHKLILSACSTFFRVVLKRNKHQHPLLYLKDVKFSDLVSVLNFMYHGEVSVAQEELNSFLAVAEDLKVKGLTQKGESDSKQDDKSSCRLAPLQATRHVPPKSNDPREIKMTESHQSSTFSNLGKSQLSGPHSNEEIQELVQPVKSEPTANEPNAGTVVDPNNLGDSAYLEEYGNYTEYDEGETDVVYDSLVNSNGVVTANATATKGEESQYH